MDDVVNSTPSCADGDSMTVTSSEVASDAPVGVAENAPGEVATGSPTGSPTGSMTAAHEDAPVDGPPHHGGPKAWRTWVARRRWPIITTFAMMVVGMAYLLFFNSLVHHQPTWATGGDLWGIFRAAHYIGWGSLGGVYTEGNGVVALPGMEVLLAPVAMVSGSFGLGETYGPFVTAHPGAALLLMPAELLAASTVVFACDALAERLAVVRRHRMWLSVTVGIVALAATSIWGHAEDCLAVTFALYAIKAALDDRWTTAGWLMGFGFAVQPLVALLVPLMVGAAPGVRRLGVVVRAAALPAALAVVAFLGDAQDAYRALVQQPTPPSINHATPWVSLSPVITPAGIVHIHGVRILPHTSNYVTAVIGGTAERVTQVAGGPGRLIYVALAVLVGVVVWRRPQTPVRLVWLAGLVLAGRCFFEPVMTPYYLAPPLFLCLVLAARQSGRRFAAAVILALEVTVFAYHHLNPWVWWLPVVASMAAILALGYPAPEPSEPGAPSEPVDLVSPAS